MELIKSSSSIMSYDINPLKHIELIARNCYKSEDKITDESCIPFVKMLYSKDHDAMLEFYPFYFHTKNSISNELLYLNAQPDINGDLMIHNHPNKPFTQLSCNLRTAIMISKYNGDLAGAIIKQYPELEFLFIRKIFNFNTTLEIDYGVDISLRYLTARFICDRGVSHELVRHRMCSFAQESTRYCNYKSGVQFIIPSYFEQYSNTDKVPHEYLVWIDHMEECEVVYKQSLADGQTPQQARNLLPNSLKTEIIVQARLSEWKHIFEQRCSKSAHPDMQALMIPFRKKVCEISNEYNNYFNN
jgi:thymidylate synthase (FAD)